MQVKLWSAPADCSIGFFFFISSSKTCISMIRLLYAPSNGPFRRNIWSNTVQNNIIIIISGMFCLQREKRRRSIHNFPKLWAGWRQYLFWWYQILFSSLSEFRLKIYLSLKGLWRVWLQIPGDVTSNLCGNVPQARDECPAMYLQTQLETVQTSH